MCGSFVFGPCFAMLYLVSILVFSIIPLGKGELVALFYLSTCCHATVSLPHGVVGLQYVIVVFSGLLGLTFALSIAAYPMLYLTYREQNSL